jgi:hypothetical protein
MEHSNKSIYRGVNRYDEFCSAAKTIAGKISKIEGVVGVLATGGIGRGFCDGFSDLDLIVFADRDGFRRVSRTIAVGQLCYKGIELDTPVESYQTALTQRVPSSYWSQLRRWDLTCSKTLYDSGGMMKRLLKEKLVFPEQERSCLLRDCREGINLHLKYNFDSWTGRGDPYNLADCLIRGTLQMIMWIYAKNGKFQPYMDKWPFYHFENDSLPEASSFATIKKPFTEPIRTVRQARRIRELLLSVAIDIGITLDYVEIGEIHTKNCANWERAPKATKSYLSW